MQPESSAYYAIRYGKVEIRYKTRVGQKVLYAFLSGRAREKNVRRGMAGKPGTLTGLHKHK
jgi:hypothetical protein